MEAACFIDEVVAREGEKTGFTDVPSSSLTVC
jgi:hypothetical protein